jgi:hypothetical protein
LKQVTGQGRGSRFGRGIVPRRGALRLPATNEWRIKVARSNQRFDEIRVFEGVAERTGATLDKQILRGRIGVCRSLTELSRKVREQGDGTFYLPVPLWPERVDRLALLKAWVPFG